MKLLPESTPELRRINYDKLQNDNPFMTYSQFMRMSFADPEFKKPIPRYEYFDHSEEYKKIFSWIPIIPDRDDTMTRWKLEGLRTYNIFGQLNPPLNLWDL